MEDLINSFLNSNGKKMSDEKRDSNNKDVKSALDSAVAKYRLPREICPNSSEHVTNNDNIPGEVMFMHDAMFLCRRIASMEMGYSQDDHLEWTFQEAKQFYQEHNLGETHTFTPNFLTEGKKSLANWYFKGRSQTYLAFLAYRWDNNMVFDNYKGRVEKCIEMRKTTDLENLRNIIAAYQDKEAQVAQLNGKVDKIKQTKAVQNDPQLLAILDGINISVLDLMED